MRSLYKLRLFEVILSKTAEFSDSQLSCWDFVVDFALKHLRSRYSLSTRKPAEYAAVLPARESRELMTKFSCLAGLSQDHRTLNVLFTLFTLELCLEFRKWEITIIYTYYFLRL